VAADAFLTFFDKAEGEATVRGFEKWIPIRSWTWGITAETSWTRGGGASVGKPNPASLVVDLEFSSASPTMLGYICTGKAFPKAEIQMVKASDARPQAFFVLSLEGVFITRVMLAGAAGDGRVAQNIELSFKTIKIDYRLQNKDGSLAQPRTFNWDIPAGIASPSA
jgi:type VI protein secretion system component Hcp